MSKSQTLIIPALGKLYAPLEDVGHALLRIVAGAFLILHGYPKFLNPTGAAGMVEALGFAPGTFWAYLLSYTEFFGGVLLVLGLLTRPAAAATSVILLVTAYAHGIAWGEGISGAEKSLIWASVLVFLAIRGGGKYSADRLIGKEV